MPDITNVIDINTVTTIVNCEKSLYSTPILVTKAAISEISTFIQSGRNLDNVI